MNDYSWMRSLGKFYLINTWIQIKKIPSIPNKFFQNGLEFNHAILTKFTPRHEKTCKWLLVEVVGNDLHSLPFLVFQGNVKHTWTNGSRTLTVLSEEFQRHLRPSVGQSMEINTQFSESSFDEPVFENQRSTAFLSWDSKP